MLKSEHYVRLYNISKHLKELKSQHILYWTKTYNYKSSSKFDKISNYLEIKQGIYIILDTKEKEEKLENTSQ
jgi:hypothetical protein